MSLRFHSIIRFPLGNYKDTISILSIPTPPLPPFPLHRVTQIPALIHIPTKVSNKWGRVKSNQGPFEKV